MWKNVQLLEFNKPTSKKCTFYDRKSFEKWLEREGRYPVMFGEWGLDQETPKRSDLSEIHPENICAQISDFEILDNKLWATIIACGPKGHLLKEEKDPRVSIRSKSTRKMKDKEMYLYLEDLFAIDFDTHQNDDTNPLVRLSYYTTSYNENPKATRFC